MELDRGSGKHKMSKITSWDEPDSQSSFPGGEAQYWGCNGHKTSSLFAFEEVRSLTSDASRGPFKGPVWPKRVSRESVKFAQSDSSGEPRDVRRLLIVSGGNITCGGIFA